MNNNLLTVTVRGPKSENFKGQALSVTSTNNEGRFDVLPLHANFITLIKEFVIIQQADSKQITFPLETGIIKVTSDKVNILIGV